MNTWNIAKENKLNAYVSFLVWPAFSLVYALANYKSSFAKNIVWFFIALFGYTFVVPDGTSDSVHYKHMLDVYSQLDINIFSFIHGVFKGEIARGDYYQPVLTYLVSRITSDYRVLFGFFGLVMGYFYSRNIWYLIEKSNNKIKPFAWIVLLFLAFVVPFWLINGVRFWTAAHIFAFGGIRLFLEKDKRYWIVIFSTVLVHIGFLLPVALLIGFLIVGIRPWVYFLFLFISVFFANLDIPTVLGLFPETLGSSLDGRVSGLQNEAVVETLKNKMDGAKWFILWKIEAAKISAAIIIIIIALFYRQKIKSYNLESIFYFSIVLLGVTNMLEFLPSMNRFFAIAHLFLFSFLFLFLDAHPPSKWLNFLIAINIPSLVMYIIIEFRGFFEFCSPGVFLTNPLLVAFFEYTKSLIQFIK